MGVLVVAGVACDLSGLWAFYRARTTVNPMKPRSVTSLVTGGIYRWTRNPMYVGLVLFLTAGAVYLWSAWALLGPVAFVAYINRFQIGPEERVMRERFGEVYEGLLSACAPMGVKPQLKLSDRFQQGDAFEHTPHPGL